MRTITDDYGQLRPKGHSRSHSKSYSRSRGRLRPITTDYDRLSKEEKILLLYLVDNEKISRRVAVYLLKASEAGILEHSGLLEASRPAMWESLWEWSEKLQIADLCFSGGEGEKIRLKSVVN